MDNSSLNTISDSNLQDGKKYHYILIKSTLPEFSVKNKGEKVNMDIDTFIKGETNILIKKFCYIFDLSYSNKDIISLKMVNSMGSSNFIAVTYSKYINELTDNVKDLFESYVGSIDNMFGSKTGPKPVEENTDSSSSEEEDTDESSSEEEEEEEEVVEAVEVVEVQGAYDPQKTKASSPSVSKSGGKSVFEYNSTNLRGVKSFITLCSSLKDGGILSAMYMLSWYEYHMCDINEEIIDEKNFLKYIELFRKFFSENKVQLQRLFLSSGLNLDDFKGILSKVSMLEEPTENNKLLNFSNTFSLQKNKDEEIKELKSLLSITYRLTFDGSVDIEKFKTLVGEEGVNIEIVTNRIAKGTSSDNSSSLKEKKMGIRESKKKETDKIRSELAESKKEREKLDRDLKKEMGEKSIASQETIRLKQEEAKITKIAKPQDRSRAKKLEKKEKAAEKKERGIGQGPSPWETVKERVRKKAVDAVTKQPALTGVVVPAANGSPDGLPFVPTHWQQAPADDEPAITLTEDEQTFINGLDAEIHDGLQDVVVEQEDDTDYRDKVKQIFEGAQAS